MTSLQYIIDSLCARITVDCVYQIIDAMLDQEAATVTEILPLIQSIDRSLDPGSAKTIVRCALDNMVKQGKIRIEGDNIFPAG
jgi:predicted transcriptional regulator